MAALNTSTINNSLSTCNDAATLWGDQASTKLKDTCTLLSYLAATIEVKRIEGRRASQVLVDRAASTLAPLYLDNVTLAVKKYCRDLSTKSGWTDPMSELDKINLQVFTSTTSGNDSARAGASVHRGPDETWLYDECLHLNFAGHTTPLRKTGVINGQIQRVISDVRTDIDKETGQSNLDKSVGKFFKRLRPRV